MGLERRQPNEALRRQRLLRGWSQKKVADLLGTSEVMVGRWEGGKKKTSPFYQEKLCDIFGMTAEELGFMSEPQTTKKEEEVRTDTDKERIHEQQDASLRLLLSSPSQDSILSRTRIAPIGESTQFKLASHVLESVVFPTTIQAYEDVLALAWELFYTSSVQRAASTVDHWLQFLALQINIAPGQSEHLIALRCRFLQLKSVIARDRTDFSAALTAINEAITIAFHLKDAELIASSLYRQAKIYAAQQQHPMAVQCLENALPYASHSRDPLRCYICMLLAEMYSLLIPGNEQFCQKSLTLLDEIDTTVRSHGDLEGDGSYVKVDTPGLYMIRGDVLRRSGKIEEAQKALVIVRENLSKEFTRWQGNLQFSEAQLALAGHDLVKSVQHGCEALAFIRATRSQSGEAKVRRLYRDLLEVKPSHPRVRELGTQLGLV